MRRAQEELRLVVVLAILPLSHCSAKSKWGTRRILNLSSPLFLSRSTLEARVGEQRCRGHVRYARGLRDLEAVYMESRASPLSHGRLSFGCSCALLHGLGMNLLRRLRATEQLFEEMCVCRLDLVAKYRNSAQLRHSMP